MGVSPAAPDRPGSGPARAPRVRPPDGLRLAFIGVLAMWLVMPFLLTGNLAQDALPYVVTGRLVRTDPDQIYASEARDLYDLKPRFASLSCELAPAGTDCANLTVAYVSSPPALPFAWLLGQLGPTAGILAARLLAAGALGGGMWVLWSRLADRTRRAPVALVASALLLTPFAALSITLGQTSPYLFLSSCLGVAWCATRPRTAATAGLWVLSVVLKLFPAVLGVVLVYQRRWRLLAWSAGVLGVLAVLGWLLAPASTWGQFLTATRLLSGYSLDNPYNGSVEAVVRGWWPGVGGGAATVALTALKAGAVVGAFVVWVRRADHDVQWSYAWLASLFFVPLVWWHYLWLAVAAVAVALAGRARITDRDVLVLPVLAAVTVPITIPNTQGSAVPLIQLLFAVAALAFTVALAAGGGRRPAVEPTPGG